MASAQIIPSLADAAGLRREGRHAEAEAACRQIIATEPCNARASGPTTTKNTYLWSEAYIDELVARDTSVNGGGVNGTTLDTVTTASATNSWSLNALGNSTSTGGVSRTVNSKNQITAISGLTSPTYDHDGNVTTDQAGNTYSYDAWNRLVFVNLPGLSTNENYTYSAGGARPGISVCNGATTTSYYSTNWQDLEDDVVTSGPTTTKNTYLWSEAYIDELVARDTSVNGGSVTRTYAQQDANHDVTSLVNSSGTVLERFIYDPYGKQTVLNASWSTTSDSYNWVYGFQGGRLDPLTGLVNFRNRDLNPVTGTWMEQDPAGYVDGANVYLAMRANPSAFTDPTGLRGSKPNFPMIPRLQAQVWQALNASVNAKDRWCPRCLQEEDDLAKAISDAVKSQGFQLGGTVGNVVSGIFGCGQNQCGDWQMLILNAVAPVFDKYGKDSCFTMYSVDAGTVPGRHSGHTHNWIEIAANGGGSTVVIDPWPTGGGEVVDDSHTGGWAEIVRYKYLPMPRRNPAPTSQPSSASTCPCK